MAKKNNARVKGALSAAQKAADRAAAALRQGKRHASDEESDELGHNLLKVGSSVIGSFN